MEKGVELRDTRGLTWICGIIARDGLSRAGLWSSLMDYIAMHMIKHASNFEAYVNDYCILERKA